MQLRMGTVRVRPECKRQRAGTERQHLTTDEREKRAKLVVVHKSTVKRELEAGHETRDDRECMR